MPEDYGLALNLSDIAEVWRHGSVVSSWLLDLIEISLAQDETLAVDQAVRAPRRGK